MIIVPSWNFRNQYFWQYKIINVFLIYKGCNALKGQEMDSNQSRAVGGTIWVHFRVHWPIWGPLDGSKAKFRPFWGRFWPSLTPHANSVKSLWSEMACTGVPQIVLHISYSTRTYWGHFRPCKVSFSALAERSSLLLRQCEFWKYCFQVIFFKCFVWNVSYASILAAQRQNYMNISLIGWSHLGSLIVKNLRQPWLTFNPSNPKGTHPCTSSWEPRR